MEFLIVIGLLVWVFTLSKRVGELEEKIKGTVRSDQGTAGYSPVSDHSYSGNEPRPLVSPQAMSASGLDQAEGQPVNFTPHVVETENKGVQPETVVSNFFAWLKQDFMVKLGAFLLLIAFGWFVSYAFANNWIGEMGRITLGLIFGALIMGLGMWRIDKRPHQGGIFMVLGSATVILTLYVARELYDMFTPAVALAIMFLSVALVSYVSVRYNRKNLALSGLILAGVAPLFTDAPDPDVVGLSWYLLVTTLGTLWVVYLRGWSILVFAALGIVFLYHLPYLDAMNEAGIWFGFLFTAIFFVANLVGLIANKAGKEHKSHLFTAVGTGVYVILWILAGVADEWQSLVLVLWMLVFSVGGFMVYRSLQSLAPFYIYGGTSIVLLAAATAVELSGPALTIAFILEIAALVILASKLFAGTRIAVSLSWLFLGPILLSFDSMDSYTWSAGLLHSDLVVLVILTLALFGVGVSFLINKNEHNKKAAPVFLVLGAVYVLVLIWLVLHAGTGGHYSSEYERGTMFSLIVYTIIGIYTYIRGTRSGSKAVALGGSILLGLVVARLLLVEVWNMEITGKIITFLVIGALLISTAFIKRNNSAPPMTKAEPENINNN